MSSIFTRIINGEIPGRFVWRDSECVAFMDIQPISRGRTRSPPPAISFPNAAVSA